MPHLRWKNLFLGTLLVSGSVALSVVLGETAFRVAMRRSSTLRWLATAHRPTAAANYRTLEAFLNASPHLIPYRNWRNYRCNALGFNDSEFHTPKAKGRFRIQALGDSFAYGLVAYPRTALTLTEHLLRAQRPDRDLELYNFGVAEHGPREYQLMYELSRLRFDPDLVVVHFYLGNDGPSLLWHNPATFLLAPPSPPPQTQPSFHAAHALINLAHIARSVSNPFDVFGGNTRPTYPGNRETRAGGERIEPLPDSTDSDPLYRDGMLTRSAFASALLGELGSLYLRSPTETQIMWHSTLETLTSLRNAVLADGRRFALVLFPHQLQVYPNLIQSVVPLLRQRNAAMRMGAAEFDPDLPNRTLLEYCHRTQVECLDLTPVFRQRAGEDPAPLYIARDSHWNIAGNRLAAETMARFYARLIPR